MKNKSARKTAPRNRANAEARGKGRVTNATDIANEAVRAEVAKRFLRGESPGEIAAQVNRSRATVYNYLAEVRLDLIRQKRGYFDDRLTIFLDDAFESIGQNSQLLADREFLLSADPARIVAVSEAFSALTDRIFYLAAITGKRTDTQAQLLPAPTGGQLAAAE